MNRLTIYEAEELEIKGLLKSLGSQYTSAEEMEFLKLSCVYAHDLPVRLRRFLNDFRLGETEQGVCVVGGYHVDDAKIGLTPSHWNSQAERSRVVEEEMLLVLLGSLLGDVFGWATQQDGRIIHDVMPIQGNEKKQLGSNSDELLCWHTEDAFHPYRGDYLAMLCLRNPERVPTTIGCIDQLDLKELEMQILFEPRFKIRPDESHQTYNRYRDPDAMNEEGDLGAAFNRIEQMGDEPENLPVLFGSPDSPYVRLDPFFMNMVDDPEAEQALEQIVRSIDKVMHDLVLLPGDCVLIDNFRTVHGRKPFKAQYNGQDRWLKRINIARDLRKSRAARPSSMHRLIF